MKVSDIPSIVRGLDGRRVRFSDDMRWELANRGAMGKLKVYQAGVHRSFWNIWLNDRIDPETGYRGMRIPVADWIEQAESDVA